MRSPKDLTAVELERLLFGHPLVRHRRRVLLALLALIPATAAYAEIVCQGEPGKGGRWVYRIIDDQRCWFRAERGVRRGQDVDRELLRWDRSPLTRDTDIPPSAEEPRTSVGGPADAPGSFQDRWQGERSRSWDIHGK